MINTQVLIDLSCSMSGTADHPYGVSYTPNNVKAYQLTMLHQLSCLSAFREALASLVIPPTLDTHFCLNYMQKSLTRGADSHLEMDRSECGGCAIPPHTTRTDCFDLERVWAAAESNFDEWA